MSQPILLIDSHYLAHRAFHTSGGLSHHGKGTGVIFGVLKSIGGFMEQFDTDRVAFCFESRHLKRRDVFPDYKIKRIKANLTKEEAKARIELARQIAQLREELLPAIGFKNVFHFDGYESDDILAALARDLSAHDEEVVIVTSDADLFQCLNRNVSIYSPQKRKLLTSSWFEKEYGLQPKRWTVVKAMSGCSGDGVPGISGIGEKTAIKYLQGTLPQQSAAWCKIRANTPTVLRNRELVELPFLGCPSPALQKDHVTEQAWKAVCGQLGMKSMAGRPPINGRRAKV